MSAKTAMVLLFKSEAMPEAWIGALQALEPGLEVRIWPDWGAPAEADFALVWKPPKGELAKLGIRARELIDTVRKFESLHGDGARYLKGIGTYLKTVEAGARSPRAEMQLLVLAIQALRNVNAGDDLDAALAPGAPYDAKRCAAMARALLAR